jgi:biotin-(acetyl-CoA carboxylase) ligase
LIAALDIGCAAFDRHGFDVFSDRWLERDRLAGCEVVVRRADAPPFRGLAAGVDSHGRLCVIVGQVPMRFDSAEVSVRAG